MERIFLLVDLAAELNPLVTHEWRQRCARAQEVYGKGLESFGPTMVQCVGDSQLVLIKRMPDGNYLCMELDHDEVFPGGWT